MQTSPSAPLRPADSTPPISSILSIRIAGYGLITLAALSIAFMAMHPTAGSGDPATVVSRVGHGIPGNTFVHGSLITVILLMAYCFLSLRDVLGAHRPLVRAAMLALIVGTAGAVAAGLVNGFIVPNLAARFVDAPPTEIEALKPVLILARETNASCARVSMVGLSIAAIAWSVTLLGFPGLRRGVGIIGLACGLAPLALHAAEHMHMNVPGFSLFVQIHALWSILAGVVLIRWQPGT